MKIEEVKDFVRSLKNVESFLSELAARDSELRYMGIASTKLWDSYEMAFDSFEGFDRKLHELIKLAKFVDRELYERISNIASTSQIAEGITQIAITVKIAEKRREREIVLRKTASVMMDALMAVSAKFVRTTWAAASGLSFSDFDVSLSKILVGLNRLIPLAEEVEETYLAKKQGDDEVFKPANINIDSIHIHIENTLNIISTSGDLGPETKEKLIEYLDNIKLELAEDSPKWRKVVGALVIVSAILGGLAVAPQALENVQKAVNEILGTSIEKAYPHYVPKDQPELPKLIMT